MRALLQGPVDGPGQGGRGAAALAQHLADEGALDVAGHADAGAGHVPAEDGAGAVAAVAVQVLGRFLGEVALHQLHPGKGRVVGVDAGVEHGHADAAAVIGGLGRAHCPDPPGDRAGRGRRLPPHRFDQAQGHGQGDGPGARVAAQVVALALGQFDLLQLDHLPAQTGGHRRTGAGAHVPAGRGGDFPAAQYHIFFHFHRSSSGGVKTGTMPRHAWRQGGGLGARQAVFARVDTLAGKRKRKDFQLEKG